MSLFKGQDTTGWLPYPASPTAWWLHNGMIAGRGPNRGLLITASGDHSNFHARVEAKINAAGSVGFCLRVPPLVSGQLRGRGYEVRIDATDIRSKKASVFDFDRAGQTKPVRAPANEWFVLEAIAVGRRIVIKVNDQIIDNVYDRAGRYSRGHLALDQTGPRTEVYFRKIEARSLTLGNDPVMIAQGGQPRSLVVQTFNGKQYLLFSQELSWRDAREHCSRLGGRLALPANESENRFLTTIAKDGQAEGVWLGASDLNFEQWISVDGSELQYYNFDEERLRQINERSQEHYPLLLVGRDGKWAHQPNISGPYKTAYICQWD